MNAMERKFKGQSPLFGPQDGFFREMVTPEKAQEWLKRNNSNRSLHPARVDAYARDMLNGRWHGRSGATIGFDTAGNLIDGQHRLSAVVRSGVTIEAYIARDVPPEARIAIDTGRGRTAADNLRMRGVQYAPMAASAAGILLCMKMGYREPNITQSEIEDTVKRHPYLLQSLAKVQGTRVVHASIVGAIHYCGAYLTDHASAADAFADVFRQGTPGYEGCPAHLLRERIIRDGRNSKFKLERYVLVNAAIHAWNLFKMQRKATKFQLPQHNNYEVDGLDRDLI